MMYRRAAARNVATVLRSARKHKTHRIAAMGFVFGASARTYLSTNARSTT